MTLTSLTRTAVARRPGGRGVGVFGDTDEEPKRARLRVHPLLASCPTSVLRRIASVADEVAAEAGEELVRQGETARWFFLIDNGQAEVVRNGVRLAHLGAGGYFGEVPLLGRGVHPATVRALTPVRGFAIDAQRFVPLVADVGRLRERLERSLDRQAALVDLAREDRRRRLSASGRGPGRVGSSQTDGGWSAVYRRPVPAVSTRPWGGGGPAGRRPRSLATLLSVVAVAVVATVVGASLYHPPVGVVAPQHATDISDDVTITGVPSHPPRGTYLMLTVGTVRPTLLGLAGAVLHGNRRLVGVPARGPRGSRTTHAASRLAAEFARSRVDAAVAAARAAGLHVGPSGSLPFSVRFRDRDVVGPSAGLIYALLIEDMLSPPDHAGGATIAATGAINPDGIVSDVGYVSEKAEEAQRGAAEFLFLPGDEVDQASGRALLVEGVASLADAQAVLRSTGPGVR